MSGISLSVGKQTSLNENDMMKLIEFYRRPDGRIFYKEFVDSMDNSFNIPELEKKPLIEVHRPAQGILSRVKFYFSFLKIFISIKILFF